MLPVTSSSIQKRRQTHRRQQSLEVPLLATPLPQRRTNSTRPAHQHRRGLSVDQALTALHQQQAQSQSHFRPLLPQEYHGPTTGHDLRTNQQQQQQHPQLDTNTAYHLQDQQQHFTIKQEPQSHIPPPALSAPSPAQSQSQNFQSHLHQQLNGTFNSHPVSQEPSQHAAMQSLQSHLMWYEQNFGGNRASSNPNAQDQPLIQVSHAVNDDMSGPVYLSHPSMSAMPVPQTINGQSHTVPNTPHNPQNWPSPPATHLKHQRSQSYQLDVAPMPQQMDDSHFANQASSFNGNNSYGYNSEQDYATSAYSSSIVDPSSPPQQQSTPMPTLYEEPSADLLLHATAGAEHDFNSPHFMVGGGPVCPEQAALDAAGIDATYIDTGISEDQINSWLIHPTGKGEPFRCKWEGCDTAVNRKENARSHVQNHLDDRRFRCNPCGKRFNRLHDTKRHHLTHTNERPAVCPCGKTFARADALTRHRQRDMCAGVLPGFEKLEEEKPKRGRPKKDRSEDGKRSGRPDMESRMHKAAMARNMDRANRSTATSMSSSSSERSMPDTPPQEGDAMNADDFLDMGGADNYGNGMESWVDTPPTSPQSHSLAPTQLEKAKVFVDLSMPEEMPKSVSPSKLSAPSPAAVCNTSHDVSSPASARKDSYADFSSPGGFGGFTGGSSPYDDGTDFFNDPLDFTVLESHPQVGCQVFSPPGESCSGSSVYNSDYDTVHVSAAVKPSMAPIPEYSQSNIFGLDDWMNTGTEDQYGEVRDMLDSWISSN